MIKKCLKKLLVVGLISVPVTFVTAKENKASSNTFSETKNSLDQDSAMLMSEEDKVLAKQWKLKDADWIKYKQIMFGPRGTWSPGLDPLTALGVSEKDPKERQRYADIWIEIESQRYELEIAFEVERMKAAKRRFGDQKMIDNSAWIAAWKKEQERTTHQALLFVDVNCKEKCTSYIADIQKSVGTKTQLDIYFKEGALADEIGEWATFMQLNRDDVRSKKITLNFDEGKSTSMNVEMFDLPKALLVDLDTGKVIYEKD